MYADPFREGKAMLKSPSGTSHLKNVLLVEKLAFEEIVWAVVEVKSVPYWNGALSFQ